MEFDKETLLDILIQIATNRYLQAVVILLLFLGVANILNLITTRFTKKWVEKSSIKLDDYILEIFHKPISLTIILLGLGLAMERLDFGGGVSFVIQSGIETVAVFLWASTILRLLKPLLSVASRDKSRFKLVEDRTLPLFNNLSVLLVVGLSIYIIFLVWNIDLTAWVASAGILGLGISFAAKDTLANLFSGAFIIADAPYKLGDFIVLDSGERGEVTNIGIRSTRILTRDDVEITIPNSIMGNTKIANEAGGRHEKFRISVKIGVAYGSDLNKVQKVLLDIAVNLPNVCEEPTPCVRFRAFGNSSLDHELLCWVKKPVLRGLVLHELNTKIYKEFQKNDIEIPFPQRDIHIKTQVSPP